MPAPRSARRACTWIRCRWCCDRQSRLRRGGPWGAGGAGSGVRLAVHGHGPVSFVARLLWLYQRLGVRWLARHLGSLAVAGLAATERLLPDVPASFVVAERRDVRVGRCWRERPAAFFAGCVMATALADVDRATLCACCSARRLSRVQSSSAGVLRCAPRPRRRSSPRGAACAGQRRHLRTHRRSDRGQLGRLRRDAQRLRPSPAR